MSRRLRRPSDSWSFSSASTCWRDDAETKSRRYRETRRTSRALSRIAGIPGCTGPPVLLLDVVDLRPVGLHTCSSAGCRRPSLTTSPHSREGLSNTEFSVACGIGRRVIRGDHNSSRPPGCRWTGSLQAEWRNGSGSWAHSYFFLNRLSPAPAKLFRAVPLPKYYVTWAACRAVLAYFGCNLDTLVVRDHRTMGCLEGIS